MPKKPLVICTKNGLCNKLRVLVSWWAYAKTLDRPLLVYWFEREDRRKHLGGACPGHFYEAFEPIEGIGILNENLPGVELDYFGCEPHEKFKPTYAVNYTDLRLRPRLQNRVKELTQQAGPRFIAVHVRRTDHVAAIAKRRGVFKNDAAFFAEIDALDTDRGIFLATDNEATQKVFIARYGDRVTINTGITQNESRHRQTGIEDAVIDLYTCIAATDFIGTPHSTFTDFINQNRRR